MKNLFLKKFLFLGVLIFSIFFFFEHSSTLLAASFSNIPSTYKYIGQTDKNSGDQVYSDGYNSFVYNPNTDTASYVSGLVSTFYTANPNGSYDKYNNEGGQNYLQEAKVNYECNFTLLGGIQWDQCAAVFGTNILRLTSWALWATGILFNYVLLFTVVQLSGTLKAISAINVAWKIFRDLSNILFIFTLLYIAIGTILGVSGVDAKKMLRNLIIAAILINFSLFITQIIIDASNITALEFYSAILNNPQSGGVSANSGSYDKGLSSAFVSAINLTTIYNDPSASSGNASGAIQNSGNANPNSETHIWQIVIATLSGSIFILITAFVFFAATLIFIYRFVAIVILMILSPLAFAGTILPYTAKQTGKWWSMLISEALVAPIFFAMIWVVLKIVSDPNFLGGAKNGTFASFAGGTGNSIAIIFNFVVVIGFLIASLTLAKTVGAAGGGASIAAFDRVRKGAQGYAGRGATRAFGIEKLNKKFEDSQFGKTRIGSSLRNVTTGALINQKFGSKHSVTSVNKVDDKVHTARAKYEFEKLEKEHNANVNSAKAAPQARLDMANRVLVNSQEKLRNARNEQEKTQAQNQINLAQKRKDQSEKEVATAVASAGTLVQAQAKRADELDKRRVTTGFFKAGARHAAAEKLRKAAEKGKTFSQTSDDNETKKLKKLLKDLADKEDGGSGDKSKEDKGGDKK